jgi:hypothetical protein
MVAGVTDAELAELPESVMQAAARNAEFMAGLTGDCIRSLVGGKAPLSFPANFLLELAAVLELGYWEQLGLSVHRDAGLPSYREAVTGLAGRVARGPAEFEGSDAAPLSRRVLCVWLERFAWNGQDLLQTEIALGDIDEENAFADLVAEFLWQHRHDTTRPTGQEEQQQ